MTDLKIIQQNGKLVADSRDVARMVEKEHSHLLRDIDKYIQVLGKSNFGLSEFFLESYYQSGNRNYKHYFLTKKGCDMVANKMIGQKGVLFTAAYVTKFEQMEKQLAQPYQLPTTYKEALLQLVDQVDKNEQLETKNLMLTQRVAEYEPKVTYLDTILQSTDTVTTTQIAKDYGMSGQQLNKILKEEKVQFKQNGQWLLYSQYHNQGYTKSLTVDITHADGRISVKMNTRWTQKGRLFIHRLLENRNIIPEMDRRTTVEN